MRSGEKKEKRGGEFPIRLILPIEDTRFISLLQDRHVVSAESEASVFTRKYTTRKLPSLTTWRLALARIFLLQYFFQRVQIATLRREKNDKNILYKVLVFWSPFKAFLGSHSPLQMYMCLLVLLCIKRIALCSNISGSALSFSDWISSKKRPSIEKHGHWGKNHEKSKVESKKKGREKHWKNDHFLRLQRWYFKQKPCYRSNS